MKFIARLLVIAFALVIVARIMPGIDITGEWYTVLIVAGILGILNAIVRPILIVLTLPITILTLGIFIFFINAGLFLLAASFVDGFYVASFLHALVGSILVSIISGIVNKLG